MTLKESLDRERASEKAEVIINLYSKRILTQKAAREGLNLIVGENKKYRSILNKALKRIKG